MKINFIVSILCILFFSSCSREKNIKNPDPVIEDSKLTIQKQTLSEQITRYAEIAKKKIDPATKRIMLNATEKLRKSEMSKNFLKVGDKAPDFDLKSFTGKEYDLYDLLEKGPVIINFYRGSWCPYCNLDLKALNEIYPEIKAMKAELLAISPEIPDRAALLSSKHSLKFPLLYDKKLKVADKYKLVFELDEKLKPIYKNFGIDLEQANADDDWTLPVPATYIISSDGLIKYAFADVDYKNRAEPEDILKALSSLSAKSSKP